MRDEHQSRYMENRVTVAYDGQVVANSEHGSYRDGLSVKLPASFAHS
jgi:hypothetical protein